MIRYWPDPSVTEDRTFSIRTSLAASTVTPGSTAPDESVTTPVIVDCAAACAGSRRAGTTRNSAKVSFLMGASVRCGLREQTPLLECHLPRVDAAFREMEAPVGRRVRRV